MMLILSILGWNVNDVENTLWWFMLCMYMGGAMTLLDIPGGGDRVVKEF